MTLSSLSLLRCARSLALLTSGVCTTVTIAWAQSAATHADTPAITTVPHPSVVAGWGTPPPTIPGIPNRPDIVTVVPFYTKPNETEAEQTKVIIPAEVDGRRGNFVVDLGDPDLDLNRTFFQPSPTGGVDTVTDANRIPDHAGDRPNTWDKVHVRMRIGTLQVADFDDPPIHTAEHPHANATLNHIFGNYTWVFAPRFGNIGLCVLEQFETIVDYTHHRLILIRLDSAGHRMAAVPAYTPRWSAPLIDISQDAGYYGVQQFWGIKVRPDATLDTLTPANNTVVHMMDTGAPVNDGSILGYPFLRQFGVIGFNHRTHQMLLYKQ